MMMENVNKVKRVNQIAFRTSEGFEYFKYDEIIRFEADGNYTLVHHIYPNSPSKAMCNLARIVKCCKYDRFYRCHKSHIINLKHVRKLHNADHKLLMKDGALIPISEKNLKEIRSMSVLH